jgi:hypothetical protein
MKRILWLFAFVCIFQIENSWAGPGDYTLRVKAGPAFNLADWENQGRLGGEFDYDFGYNLGFNLYGAFGISSEFRFDLIPSVRIDYLLMGPAAMYATVGGGYSVLGKENGFGMKFGTGLSLPLGDFFEFNTDVNLITVAAGTPGTPTTLEWLLGLGFRFH